MIIINCAQGSDEWLRARAGVITASKFKIARAKMKANRGTKRVGDPTDEALKTAFTLAIERISGQPLDDGYQTYVMKRGHELEPAARWRHQEEIGVAIDQTGLVLTDDRLFGGSADGLIGDDGGAEYKCLIAPDSLMPVLIDGDISEYTDQVQGCMWVTGRKWWDFCLYCPALAPAGKDLTRLRIARDDDYIERLELDLLEFNRIVEGYERQLRGAR